MKTNNHLKKILQFHLDGSLCNIYYLNDRNQKHYIHNTFGLNGELVQSIYYRNGKQHGSNSLFQNDIDCISHEFWKNGEKHGLNQYRRPKRFTSVYYYNGKELFERTDEKLIQKCIQDQNDIKQFWNDFTFEVISTEILK